MYSVCVFFFKQKTAYEMRISDWSSDVCSSDLFYSRRLYAGLGMDRDGLVMHRYGRQRRAGPSGTATGPMRIRITNDRNIVTIETSLDGGHSWRRFGVQREVSGYHHNVAGDFLSLRPALYAAGKGIATFRDFRYEALS